MTEPRDALAGLFRLQAIGCRGLGSPLWADMCDRLAGDAERGGSIFELLAPYAETRVGEAYTLRVLGGAHRLALAGDAPELARHLPSTGGDADADAAWAELAALVADPPAPLLDALNRPPQTNEVGRSASLIGGFLVVAGASRLPLRVREIGTSAGLNLRFDHFRYEQGDTGFGPAASPVRFTELWSNGTPPFDAPLTVTSRRGCDLDPIDVTTADGRLTLLSYVWPDQLERFERTAAAIDIAADVPAEIDRANAPDWLASELAEPPDGQATVVFHSIMWQYLADDTRRAIGDVIERAGEVATDRAPVAWLRLEPDDDHFVFPRLRLTTWPSREDRLLAECGWHLSGVDWLV